MVICETEDEVQKYWDRLLDGGIALMELGSYSWSPKYGWVQDKYGVTWQIIPGRKSKRSENNSYFDVYPWKQWKS
ncbi:VOC family protein [Chryseobacterium sp. 1B4]